MESADVRGAPRRGRPGHDRNSMLEVIVQVFTDHGYDASSLEMIARRLGLSKSAVYYHFSSKAEMLEIALERALGELERVFDEAESQPGDAVSRIGYIVRHAVLVACERRQYLTLLLRLHGNSDVELRALERRRVLTARLRGTFEAARDEGSLRDDLDPGLAARFTFGLVNSLVEWYRPDGPIDPEALADALLSYVRTGLRLDETDFR
ncbi:MULTISPECIES: TetR/AcrR family transcriptional regulator [unclassified Isoptericola]|uniref:TetR/AcrR family transcriptional regulator n=1 Tax=unclassified Isoptericola TaxID=2623355 RepID=UPI002712BDF9|nr:MULTISPECIES: TetR/AcrR family transcriptional regulator [unclassified Isoptericola]MDO8145397.1 TetR/AcrR family transcriptional regulator [Isoptericola sp. 178]MDO8149038.1 TetR/AcrR family transcriptional regulator [Isoptericola sp. b515]MDO8151022.1 TetR/AcrR family transcriptional regulator [Isoptericola sp. b408]